MDATEPRFLGIGGMVVLSAILIANAFFEQHEEWIIGTGAVILIAILGCDTYIKARK